MKTFLVFLVCLFVASCSIPTSGKDGKDGANGSNGSSGGTVTLVAPIPDGMTDYVASAVYLRAPVTAKAAIARDATNTSGIVGALGIITDDPLLAQCTVPNHLYMFYADSSVVDYTAKDDADHFNTLSVLARLTCEAWNGDHPTTPEDYVGVPPPAPPPTTHVDPSVPQGCVWIVGNSDVPFAKYGPVGLSDWAGWQTTVPQQVNADGVNYPSDAPYRAVWGAPPTS